MAKYCDSCGNRCSDNSSFCTRCGSPLAGGANITGQPKPEVQPKSKPEFIRSNGSAQQKKNRNYLIIIGALILVAVVFVVGKSLIHPSIKGTWILTEEDEGESYEITIDDSTFSMISKETTELGNEKTYSETYTVNEITDNKICFSRGDDMYSKEYLWYRIKGKKMYLYDDIETYNKDQPDVIYYRK